MLSIRVLTGAAPLKQKMVDAGFAVERDYPRPHGRGPIEAPSSTGAMWNRG